MPSQREPTVTPWCLSAAPGLPLPTFWTCPVPVNRPPCARLPTVTATCPAAANLPPTLPGQVRRVTSGGTVSVAAMPSPTPDSLAIQVAAMGLPRSGSGDCVDAPGGGDVPGGNAAAAAVHGHPPSPSPASATDTPAVGATHRRAASATDASRPWEDVQRTEMLERLKREFFMPPVVENPYTVNHVVGEVRGDKASCWCRWEDNVCRGRCTLREERFWNGGDVTLGASGLPG